MKKDELVFLIYSVLSFVAFVIFVPLDFINDNLRVITYFKYSIIFMSFLFLIYAFIRCLMSKRKMLPYLLAMLAMLFTLVSDVFLFILDNYYVVGLTTFIIAQLLYAFRIELVNNDKRYMIASGSIRTLVVVVSLIIFLIRRDDFLIYLVIIYFLNLILNCVFSLLTFLKDKEKKHMLVMSIGFFLFILCDISVGLYNLNNGFNGMEVNKELASIFLHLIWIFYAPSQYLLTLSVDLRGKYEQKEECC